MVRAIGQTADALPFVARSAWLTAAL